MKKIALISLFPFLSAAQPAIYKINDLLQRIACRDTVYVVNFWATWCKPCVQELPSFDSLGQADRSVKVLLVSLDFREDLESKVVPFLRRKNINTECVLLDETNGNDFINMISPRWSGAIPATLFVSGKTRALFERKFTLAELTQEIRARVPNKKGPRK